MPNEQVKQLCTSGAFSVFQELMNEIELPEIIYGEDLTYQVGKRDGAVEFKAELIDLITKIAKT